MEICTETKKDGNACIYPAKYFNKCGIHKFKNRLPTKISPKVPTKISPKVPTKISPKVLDEKELKTGLRLSKKLNYQKISGPVSLNYMETFNGKHGILLFGDIHHNKLNMCDTSINCTLLQGDELLKHLNKLSTKNRKVSFYSEYGPNTEKNYISGKDHKGNKINLIEFIGSIYTNKHVYKNINFIGTDIRKENGAVKNLCQIYHCLQEYLSEPTSFINEKLRINNLINLSLIELGFTLESFCIWISGCHGKSNHIQYLIKTFLEHVYRNTIISNKKDILINSILELNIPTDILFESLSNTIDSKDLLVYNPKPIKYYDYDTIFNFMQNILSDNSVEYNKNLAINLIILLLDFCAILTDIYTNICICINISKSSNTLSIIYYGDQHIHQLKKILTHSGYILKDQLTIPKSVKKGTINRCLDLENAGFFFNIEEFLQR
jgi:hypothetical protein